MQSELRRLQESLPARYRLRREIGRGGMATVYLAEDTQNHNRPVAIKVLKPSLASAVGSRRFKREIKIAANLAHPHIVPLHDSDVAGELLFYVMPFVDGSTLRDALRTEGPLSIEKTLAITEDVAAALEHAHQRGVVHRDIKPSNILLVEGQAVVTDFGVARALAAAATGTASSTQGVLGTPVYMSPEQVSGDRDLDGRSDQYSLACVVYEMLTGEAPHSAESVQVTLARKFHGEAPDPSVKRPDLSLGVVLTIQRALAVDPRKRFVSVSEFALELAAAARGELTGWRLWLERWRRLSIPVKAAAAIMVVAAGYGLYRALQPPVGPAFTGRPATLVALPIRTPASAEPEVALATRVASRVTAEINQWDGIAAVSGVALAGPLFDLGVTGAILDRLDQGIELARDLGVQAFLSVTVALRGDTARVEAALFDASTGSRVGRPLEASAPPEDVAALTLPLVALLLELDGSERDLSTLRRHSSSAAALAQEEAGRRALESWSLDEAEARFREAIAADSTFALAYHRLAQTLYWRAVDGPGDLSALGLEIAGASAGALRHAADLPAVDSLHIRGFYEFQRGAYSDARRVYRDLLERDPADVYAWLMLGSVEFRDPWLETSEGGGFRPRSDLDAATHAFAETLRLQPMFHIGYGHLFDIHALVVAAMERGACSVFEEPSSELVPPWEFRVPTELHAFCAVATDSIRWIDALQDDVMTRLRSPPNVAGADRLFERSLLLLERWAAFSPEATQPRAELVEALLDARRRLGRIDPDSSEALAARALRFAEEILALRPDSAHADLLRVAQIMMGTSRAAEADAVFARAIAERSAEADSAAPLPRAAANFYLARGHPGRAAEILERNAPVVSVPDPETGAHVPYGGAERAIERLRALGASGVEGPPVEEGFEELSRRWSELRYSEGERALLRASAVPDLALALTAEPARLADWTRDTPTGRPLWDAFGAPPGSEEAERLFPEALSTPTPELSAATRQYLLGRLAARRGNHAEAARLFSGLDSIPLSLDALDLGWALRPLSNFDRGRAYEALGDRTRALASYEALIRAWAGAGPLGRPIVDAASEAADRLRRSN